MLEVLVLDITDRIHYPRYWKDCRQEFSMNTIPWLRNDTLNLVSE